MRSSILGLTAAAGMFTTNEVESTSLTEKHDSSLQLDGATR
jgi:hypothetical protein